MNIVILGNGILAKEIISQTNWPSISRSKDGFELMDKSTYAKHLLEIYHGVIVTRKYDIIINCIANTDTYSDNRSLHWDTNYRGVIWLSDFCEEHGIKLVHISTDYVYTNSVNEASEEDIPIHGNNWYSYTKLLGDSYVQLNPKNLILRGTHKPYPFPHKEAWVDQIGNFDYINNIANLIVKVIQKNETGVVNIGTEIKSMFTLASKTNHVIPKFTNNNIPKNTSMNINKLQKILN